VGRARTLLAAVEAAGAGAFVADTAPLVYRLERRARPALTAACDPLFDAVQAGALACIVSAVSVAELLVQPFRAGPAAVAVADGFLRQPNLGVAALDGDLARAAAALVARRSPPRLPDAAIVATAQALRLPLVTGDRRLARTGLVSALLVSDYA
jgi:predicted nucleic acid-binding protein